MRFGRHSSDSNEVVGRELTRILVHRYGFTGGGDLDFAVELALECADAIARRGLFRVSGNEDRFRAAAVAIVTAILTPCSPGGGHVQVAGHAPL